jgi:hypothetical protein
VTLPQHFSVELHALLPQQVPFVGVQNLDPPVPVQHVWPVSQDELPQHVFPALMQYFEPPVPVQQVCPALQPVLPQQNPPDGAQNVEPPGPVQQVWPALHEELPQHVFPALMQNFEPPGPVQHVCPALHEELPQHNLPAAIQKFPGQQVWVGLQAGEQLAASAGVGLSPKVLRIPPASALPNNLRALRRGTGLARMRATSSNRFCMFPPLPVIQFFDTRVDEPLQLLRRVEPHPPTHRNRRSGNYKPTSP